MAIVIFAAVQSALQRDEESGLLSSDVDCLKSKIEMCVLCISGSSGAENEDDTMPPVDESL